MLPYPIPMPNFPIQPEDDPICENIPNEEPLPYFSHTPPANIRGRKRWPTSLDAQGFPATEKPTLADILIWVSPYLEPRENAKLHEVSTEYRHGPGFGPLWFYRPWSPNRRRRWGFGIPDKNRTVVNDIPPPTLAYSFHMAVFDYVGKI